MVMGPNDSQKQSPGANIPKDDPQIDFGKFVSDASRKWSSQTPESDHEPTKSKTPQSGHGGENIPPPKSSKPGPSPARRNSLALAIVALVTLVGSIVAIDQFNDPSVTSTPPIATSQSTVTVPPSATDPVPTATTQPSATLAPEATLPPTATTEPTVDVSQSQVAGQCSNTCLVRIASTDKAEIILRETAGRASISSDQWMWAIASRTSIASLDLADEDVLVLRDSSETLDLYFATLPEGQSDFSILGGFGEIIDSNSRNAVVSVAAIPADVKTTAALGIDIQKLAPGPTALISSENDDKPQLEESDIYGLGQLVDSDEILTTLTDLQGTSSTDGTGIGTRQYLQPGNVVATEYLFRRLESYGLTVHYEDFISPEFTLASNIVAEIPGRDQGAIYGVMAHFDSDAESFAVAPGADDNATGVAAALEIARILGQYDLKHPVHIIFVNAEETGIVGSRILAKNAVADGVPYEGVFNLDSVGSDRRGSLIWLNSDLNSEWMMSLVMRVNNAYGLGQDIQARINPGIVADDNRLREEGFESILVAREFLGGSPYHHTSSDVLANVSVSNTLTATQLILLTIASLVIS